MAITITISGTPIEFPDSGTSPDWAEAVDAFAIAVQDALSGIVGPDDIPPQTFSLSPYNPGTVAVTNLVFSTATVRSAIVRYSIYRTTTLADAAESGNLFVTYNPDAGVGNKWDIAREYQSEGSVSFTISDTGQISITTAALSGTSHVGVLTFAAQALLQS